MELTIKELAAYLPYGLKIINGWGDIKNLNYTHLDDENNGIILQIKPILYPLDFLTKEITHNGEVFVPIEKMQWLGFNFSFLDSQIFSYKEWDYEVVQQLLEWKLDVFKLIENNLAIPVTEDFNPYQ